MGYEGMGWDGGHGLRDLSRRLRSRQPVAHADAIRGLGDGLGSRVRGRGLDGNYGCRTTCSEPICRRISPGTAS